MSLLEKGTDILVHNHKAAVLVTLAIGVHVLNLNIMRRNSKIPLLVGPNLPSCIFVLSSACIMRHFSPKRPQSLTPGQVFSTDALEFIIVLTFTEVLNLFFWRGASNIFLYFVDFLTQYTHEVLPDNSFKRSIKYILQNHMFYAVRLMLAMVVFIAMLRSYKLDSKIWRSFVNWIKNPGRNETHLMRDSVLLPRRRDRESSVEEEVAQPIVKATPQRRKYRTRVTSKQRRTK